MTVRVLASLFGLCLLLAPAAPARAAEEAVLARIRAEAAKVTTIRADFRQEKRLSVFDETLVSRGRFLYAKPDRLRWEVTDPVMTGFTLAGKTGRRWHEMAGGGSEPFSTDRDPLMGAVAEQLMAWTSADFDRLGAQYVLSILAESPPEIGLAPRSPALTAVIEGVEVHFSADARYVEEVIVREPGGDATRILFLDVKLNTPVAAEEF